MYFAPSATFYLKERYTIQKNISRSEKGGYSEAAS